MTDDEILARIRAKKAARKKPGKHAFRPTLRKFLGKMKVGRTYSIEDIEVFLVESGRSFTGAGGATTYGVREGYLERVGKGQYVVTGKRIEG
jgi:hypothetical protein